MNIQNNNSSRSVNMRGNEKKFIAAGMAKLNKKENLEVEHLLPQKSILGIITKAIKKLMV